MIIKDKLVSLADKYPILHYLKFFYQRIRDSYYYLRPIDKKTIIFESFRSSKYADSPRAIYEYLLDDDRFKDYNFIWSFKDVNKYQFLTKNPRTKIIKYQSREYRIAYATASHWVTNGWIPRRVHKRKGRQVALQCWHGTPLKRLRLDIEINTEHRDNAVRDNDDDTSRYDYFISPSSFASGVFTSAFNLKNLHRESILIETGYPRNDFLINYTDNDVAEIKKKYNLPADKKIILYTPTWRDDNKVEGVGYQVDIPIDFDKWRDEFGDEYIILFRAHYLVADSFDFDKYTGFIYNISSEDDIKEFYVISDLLITDYSSTMFDFAILRRPMIFYMYDLDHYAKDLRGFYFDLSELPGDIVKTEHEIIDMLHDIPTYNKKHAKKYQAFNDKFNYLDDGKATERVVNKVFK